jgi:hypothetical protein
MRACWPREGTLIGLVLGANTSLSDHSIDRGTLHSGNAFISRHEMRTKNGNTVVPSLGIVNTERGVSSATFDFEQMLQALHELFEHDRQIASQPNSTRCGVCYLHFVLSELQYRNEGFYICSGCNQSLGHQNVPMLHKQQKL